MFAVLRWILKRFWFPILLIVLSRLGKKHEWAKKTHDTIRKYT
ncbi:MAG: hypothetical protein RLY88_754 [Actinomycetota bacterium]|jgi:hypothetical protein